jgi:hypothetical protein
MTDCGDVGGSVTGGFTDDRPWVRRHGLLRLVTSYYLSWTNPSSRDHHCPLASFGGMPPSPSEPLRDLSSRIEIDNASRWCDNINGPPAGLQYRSIASPVLDCARESIHRIAVMHLDRYRWRQC